MSFLSSIQNFNQSWFPGLVPRSDGDPAKFLCADGTFKGPGSSLGGTVTSVATDATMTGGPITTTGTLSVIGLKTATGIVNVGSSAAPAGAGYVLVSTDATHATWQPFSTETGFVKLQAATPGTPDTGNASLTGTLLLGTPTPTLAYPSTLGVTAVLDEVGVQITGQGGTEWLVYLQPTVGAVGVQIDGGAASTNTGLFIGNVNLGISVSANGPALQALSAIDHSGYFSAEAGSANTSSTVVIQQEAALTANLLELWQGDNTVIGQFQPVGARLGLGNLPGVPDSMLHLYGGNTFTGNAGIIIQNDSRTDLSNVSKLSFADTNTAATLSNACIVFETQAGAAGNLQFYMGGSDNDTPGPLASQIVSTATQTAVTVQNPGALNSGIALLSSGAWMGLFVDGNNIFHLSQAMTGSDFASGADLLTIDTSGSQNGDIHFLTAGNINFAVGDLIQFSGFNGGAYFANGNFSIAGDGSIIGSGGAFQTNVAGDIAVATNAMFSAKVAVGSATLGSHALDVTGNAGFTDQIISTLVTGAAPLVVASVTPVLNLTLSADTQLPTISTAGKVSNSATTATVASTASTIALRGSDGSLTATAFITASLQAAFVASPYGASAGQTGEMRFKELAANGVNYVGFKAPDLLAGNLMYTLPTLDAAGPLMSNGSGILNPVAGASLTILVPVANKTLTFTNGVLMSVV